MSDEGMTADERFLREVGGDWRTKESPLIVARDLENLEYLGGIVSHETCEVRVHLTFTELSTMTTVIELLLVTPTLTDQEKVLVAVPGSWSLYVHPKALAYLQESLAFRVEGR